MAEHDQMAGGEHGPSEKAVEAAVRECARLLSDEIDGNDAAKAALDAAHDPALGLDRSVCLRDVVDKLGHEVLNNRDWTFDHPGGRAYKGWADAIDFLIHAFTESSSPDREGVNRG